MHGPMPLIGSHCLGSACKGNGGHRDFPHTKWPAAAPVELPSTNSDFCGVQWCQCTLSQMVQQIVLEFCYPKLAQKLCVGVSVGGSWVGAARTLNTIAT